MSSTAPTIFHGPDGTQPRRPEQVADELSGMSPDELLAVAADADRLARAAELQRLECALAWALAHPASPEESANGWVEIAGGEGTPDVEEFTAEPLAAVFATTSHSARALISDALDLAYRLPKTWARVRALEVPGWRARRIAQNTTGLSQAAAAAVDEVLAPKAHKCGIRAIDAAIAEATADAEPHQQVTDEQARKNQWGVDLFHPEPTGPAAWKGTSTLLITGDTVDLTHLYDQITQLATGEVAASHPDETLEVRQALAVGVLARRMNGGKPPRVKLYLHANASDVCDDTIGTGAVERLGPISMAKIKDWVGHAAVTVLPVLRTDRADAVDQHDPPAWMRELVILRDQHCVHPYCATDARACDLDHIDEYIDMDDGGPPGQTHPGNLAPLCRRHHRAKTRRRWRYRPLAPGVYLWTGPHGRHYLVTPDGTEPV